MTRIIVNGQEIETERSINENIKINEPEIRKELTNLLKASENLLEELNLAGINDFPQDGSIKEMIYRIKLLLGMKDNEFMDFLSKFKLKS